MSIHAKTPAQPPPQSILQSQPLMQSPLSLPQSQPLTHRLVSLTYSFSRYGGMPKILAILRSRKIPSKIITHPLKDDTTIVFSLPTDRLEDLSEIRLGCSEPEGDGMEFSVLPDVGLGRPQSGIVQLFTQNKFIIREYFYQSRVYLTKVYFPYVSPL